MTPRGAAASPKPARVVASRMVVSVSRLAHQDHARAEPPVGVALHQRARDAVGAGRQEHDCGRQKNAPVSAPAAAIAACNAGRVVVVAVTLGAEVAHVHHAAVGRKLVPARRCRRQHRAIAAPSSNSAHNVGSAAVRQWRGSRRAQQSGIVVEIAVDHRDQTLCALDQGLAPGVQIAELAIDRSAVPA